MRDFLNSILGSTEKRKTILWAIIILVAALVILIVFNSLFYSSNDKNNFGQLSNWADMTSYQAVFLTNGQVYFGKVTDVNSQTLILEDVYYLRASKDLQINSQADQNSDFSLVKLGKEIHGPEDKMSVNISQVLFTENMKNDSKVVEAIRAYEKK